MANGGQPSETLVLLNSLTHPLRHLQSEALEKPGCCLSKQIQVPGILAQHAGKAGTM